MSKLLIDMTLSEMCQEHLDRGTPDPRSIEILKKMCERSIHEKEALTGVYQRYHMTLTEQDKKDLAIFKKYLETF